MADALTVEYINAEVRKLLPIGSTTIYDNQLDVLIRGAISKLNGEGVRIDSLDKNGDLIFQQGTFISYDYIICISYQLLKDLDYDADFNYLTEQYITRIGTLRCYISTKQN